MNIIKTTFLSILSLLSLSALCQSDSTHRSADTIHVGGTIIINKSGKTNAPKEERKKHPHHVNTSEMVLDLGFANWTDNTDYAFATSQQFLVNKPGQPTLNKNDLKLRTGKSSNVNIWFVMQRLDLIQHYVSLKYGLGIEMNNYRFNSPISFKESGLNPYFPGSQVPNPYILRDSISFSKNKLSADYATIPLMLNFRTNPKHPSQGLSISAGASVGYLYSCRNKQVSSERGKRKNHGEYGLEKWKFSYIGELGFGGARLYGSYTPASIFEKGFSIIPYTIGIRLSNW